MYGYHQHSEAARDEFEPRGTDICPQCGSGHTTYHGAVKFAFWKCGECGSRWASRSVAVEYQYFIYRIFEKSLLNPKLSDMVET